MTLSQSVSRFARGASRRALLAFALVGSIAAATTFAHQTGNMPNHPAGAENIVAHVDGMLQYVYAQAGATETQKAQLASIVQQAQTDLAQLQAQGGEEHAHLFGLLTQATIDRNAIETEYAAHMKNHEQTSKRTLQFLIDVAEALTPAQRKALSDHFQQHTAKNG